MEEQHDLRAFILEHSKSFKTSWVELGRALYAVWKDKLYLDWGYQSFEAYTAREVGVVKKTAMKLLKNYFFLEEEEPRMVQQDYTSSVQPATLPQVDAVNTLRLASRRKDLKPEDYKALRSEVFDNGSDVTSVRKALTQLIKQRQQQDPEEARQQERMKVVKRFLATLRSLNRDMVVLRLVPEDITREATDLIHRIEMEIRDSEEPQDDPAAAQEGDYGTDIDV
jgi:hypothetical protein